MMLFIGAHARRGGTHSPQKISARMLMLLLSERYLCTVPASCRGMFGNLSVSVEFSCQK